MFTFNYKDGTQSISLSDINAASSDCDSVGSATNNSDMNCLGAPKKSVCISKRAVFYVFSAAKLNRGDFYLYINRWKVINNILRVPPFLHNAQNLL